MTYSRPMTGGASRRTLGTSCLAVVGCLWIASAAWAVEPDSIVAPSSDLLALTKEFTDDPVAPGEIVTLEFTLTNLDRTAGALDIAFEDDLGAALPGLILTKVQKPGDVGCDGTSTGVGTSLFAASAPASWSPPVGGGSAISTRSRSHSSVV